MYEIFKNSTGPWIFHYPTFWRVVPTGDGGHRQGDAPSGKWFAHRKKWQTGWI